MPALCGPARECRPAAQRASRIVTLGRVRRRVPADLNTAPAVPRPPVLKITITQPGSSATSHEIAGDQAKIGRADDCDIVLSDGHISRRHALVLRIDGRAVVVDLGSANGIFIDGEKIVGGAVLGNSTAMLGGEVALTVEDGDRGGASWDDEATGHADGVLQEELDGERRRVASLLAEIEALRGQVSAGAETADSAAVVELRTQLADMVRRNDELKADLSARAEAPAESAQMLIGKLEAEKGELLAQVGDLRTRLEAGGQLNVSGAGGEKLMLLVQENAKLRQDLEAATSGTADAGEVGQLKDRLATLTKELQDTERQRAQLAASVGAQAAGSGAAGAAPRVPSTHPSTSSGVAAALRAAASSATETSGTDHAPDAADFLALELLRYARTSERFVSRLAGDYFQLLSGGTIMPGMQSSLGELVTAVVDAGGDPGPRAEFLEYIQKLQHWLLASHSAYSNAAEKVAIELRDNLTEKSLTDSEPIPRFKVMAGQKDGELWTRARRILDDVSSEMVRGKVEDVARAHAIEIVERMD